jgi:hypothetical protein
MHIVCNKDTDLYVFCEFGAILKLKISAYRPDVKVKAKGNVRVGMTVAMVCQTVIDKAALKRAGGSMRGVTRKDVMCKIVYVAQG